MARRRRRSDVGGGYAILGVLTLAAVGWLIEFVQANKDVIVMVVIVVVGLGMVMLVVSRLKQASRQRLAIAEERRLTEQRAVEAQRLIAQKQAQDQVRRETLLLRYGDQDLVDAIMGRRVRIGMTKEHLIESWGHPHDIKETILKTKRKEEFKYNNVGVNRYLSRVFLEDGFVVGWKQ